MINRKGLIKAREILEMSGLNDLRQFSLDDLVLSRDATILYEPLDGCEGRIEFRNSESIITINKKIELLGKKRFVLAHEFGHHELHKNDAASFSDGNQNLHEWHTKGNHENEANDFAKELLMPEKILKPLCKGQFSMELIKNLAAEFKVSVTTTLLRYKDVGDFPLALIYTEKGIIQWKFFSEDFILQFLPIKNKVPVNTVVYDYFFNKIPITDEALPVFAYDWFAEDFNLKYHEDEQFFEQCFCINSSSVLSCLWEFN